MTKVQSVKHNNGTFQTRVLVRLVEFNIFKNYNFALASAKHENNLTQSSFTNGTDLE